MIDNLESIIIDTPLGWLEVVATRECIVRMDWQMPPLPTLSRGGKGNGLLTDAKKQIREYFAGKRQVFSLPYSIDDLPAFSQRVLLAMAEIPFGQVATYQDLARAAGSPRAARAVGNICRTNLLPILIPCHRVVATVGLGGYNGGLDKKRWLLDLEST